MAHTDDNRAPFTIPEGTPVGQPNCGLVAMAVFTGTDYQTVLQEYKRYNRKPGNWKGGTRHHERKPVVRKLNKRRSASFSIRRKYGRMTLKTWARRYAQPGVLYMVQTTGHMQCIQDGWVIDQLGPRKLEGCRTGNKMAQWAMAIK